MEKWTSLYTIQILTYAISRESVLLLAFAQATRLRELAALPCGWEPPRWVKTLGDTTHDLDRSISWGIEDLLVHLGRTHSVMLPYSIRAWAVALLMDCMVRVYYWRSQRKWEREKTQAQEHDARTPGAVWHRKSGRCSVVMSSVPCYTEHTQTDHRKKGGCEKAALIIRTLMTSQLKKIIGRL